MKINHNPIADGAYVRERRRILKDLRSWGKMTDEEKDFFRPCHRCTTYDRHIMLDKGATPCPCLECKHRKTEIQVDNQMTKLRRKYLEGDY